MMQAKKKFSPLLEQRHMNEKCNFIEKVAQKFTSLTCFLFWRMLNSIYYAECCTVFFYEGIIMYR